MIDRKEVNRVQQFHGHMCPGLAMGIRAAEIALDQIGPHAGDEEVVAVVETDMCGVDAIQVLTGCTFGKGNLVHRDYGKNAYSFFRRSDGKAIRVITKPKGWGERDPHWEGLFAKVREGSATEEERQEFGRRHLARAEQLLAAPIEDLYDVVEISTPMPRKARIHKSLRCTDCGESTMETRIRLFNGNYLCEPCFQNETGGRLLLASPRRLEQDLAGGTNGRGSLLSPTSVL